MMNKQFNTVIIYGPQGCGKTKYAEEFRRYFNCEFIIDDWNPKGNVIPNALHLTNVDIVGLAIMIPMKLHVDVHLFGKAYELTFGYRDMSQTPHVPKLTIENKSNEVQMANEKISMDDKLDSIIKKMKEEYGIEINPREWKWTDPLKIIAEHEIQQQIVALLIGQSYASANNILHQAMRIIEEQSFVVTGKS